MARVVARIDQPARLTEPGLDMQSAVAVAVMVILELTDCMLLTHGDFCLMDAVFLESPMYSR